MIISRKKCIALLFVMCASGMGYLASAQQLQVLKIKNTKELKEFFRYKGKNTPIISGHRGGMVKGFPENSIETFENTLKYTPAFYEIDPRLTKDGVVVLMHDATLDRTTTGKGKVSDYTYAELQKLRLKDPEGHVTDYKIPTLKEAILWSRGKTMLNLDRKDVPPELTVKILTECKNDIIMLTVHTPEQAKFYYDHNPKWMFSVLAKTEEAFKEYVAAGIPYSNMMAYIGPENKPENKALLDMLHAKGVMGMISAAPTYDKLPDVAARAKNYRETFAQGADVLESDLPIEVAAAIKNK